MQDEHVTESAGQGGRGGKPLKVWNGNAQTFAPYAEKLKHGVSYNGYVHAYGCARSRAELCRMLTEWAGGQPQRLDSYLREYWNEGAWGNSMAGIEPEPGVWVQWGRSNKPERVWPPESSALTRHDEPK
jgi:hypothetical protein